MKLLSILHETYEKLSEKEKQSIYWGYKLIGAELSKFIIIFIFFILIGKWGEFLISIIMLLPLRCNMGGLHFKTYHVCFMVSFAVFVIAILFLPKIVLPYACMIIFLLICLILNVFIGPIINPTRPALSKFQIKRCKKRAVLILIFDIILYCTFPTNQYIICGIWITIEQTLQLVISKLQRRTSK